MVHARKVLAFADSTVKPTALSWLLAVPLFAIPLIVYGNTLPGSFNTRYENRVFFRQRRGIHYSAVPAGQHLHA